MPYNGSGTFSLTYDWTTEQASSPIEISKLDEQEADIAAGLSNCVLRDGTGVPTSATPWNSQNLTGVGSLTAVSGTFSGAVTATSLVPSSSTVPANGLYLPAANTVGIASNTALRGSVNSTGNWVFAAPSSGTALTVSGPDSAVIAAFLDTTSTSGVYMRMGDSVGSRGYMGFGSSTFSGAAISDFGIAAASGVLRFSANGGTNTHMQIANAGNVTIAAPSSGTTLALTGVANGNQVTITDGTITSVLATAPGKATWGATSNHALGLYSNSVERITIAAAGNVTINAPSSGNSLVSSSLSGSLAYQATATTGAAGHLGIGWSAGISSNEWNVYSSSTDPLTVGTNGSATLKLATNNTVRVTIAAASGNVTFSGGLSGITTLAMTGALSGATTGAFSAGLTCTTLGMGGALTGATTGSFSGAVATGALTVTGAISASTTISDQAGGVRIIPQNAQTGNYTCVLADAGKHIYHAAGAGAGDTYTIPANGSVAYTIGTAITFINRDTTNNLTIAITTDTLTQAGTGSTGSRTLGTYGVATAIKITATEWIISGTNLS